VSERSLAQHLSNLKAHAPSVVAFAWGASER
jgi:hypothetical protein